jgi:hypothetical protein
MRRRRTAISATVASLVVFIGGTTPAYADATVQDPARPEQTVAYFAHEPLPTNKSTPVDALPAQARAQLAGEQPARPLVDTPRGYRLRANPTTGEGGSTLSDFRYRSAFVFAIEARCGIGGCTAVQQVRLRMEERLRGGQTWAIGMEMMLWSGPPQFFVDYFYECGVNINNAIDQTCSTWRDDGASGPEEDAAFHGLEILRSMGAFPAIKFPMLKLDVEFADGSRAIGDDGDFGEKFRGWDVCMVQGGVERLCAETGTGD